LIGRQRGEQYRLPAFIRAHIKVLRRDYRKLPKEEKEELLSSMMASRAAKQNIIRSNPKALQADVNSTFSAMENEV
jgi:hypothetical protein